MENLGTPNNKAIYSRLADAAHAELNNQYHNDTAIVQVKALLGQIRVFEAEIKAVNAVVKTDEHNKKHGTSIRMRNVEIKKFDQLND